MSDYWQAIERGLGGSLEAATARPRSLFEEPFEGLVEDAEMSLEGDAVAVAANVPEGGAGASASTASQVPSHDPPSTSLPEPRTPSPGPTILRETVVEKAVVPVPAIGTAPVLAEPVMAAPAPPQLELVAAPAMPAVSGSIVPISTASVPDLPIIAEPSPSPRAVPAAHTPTEADAGVRTVVRAEPAAEPVVVAKPLPVAAPPDDRIGDAPAAPAAPVLTIEIGEVQIRLSSEAPVDSGTLRPCPAPGGETASLTEFLACQSGASR